MRVSFAFVLTFTCSSLIGCVGGGGGTDSGVLHDGGPITDTGPRMDTGIVDSGPIGTGVTMAQLTNASLPQHPATNTNVTVTDSLVALSPRLFISQSTTSGKCLFAAWVGTPTGGDFSGIEVTDSFLPPANPDGGAGDCFSAAAHIIPDTLNIGDTVTTLAGEYQDFCLAPAVCPPSTSEELSVSSGTFTVGAPGTSPTPTTVTVPDVTGMMVTLGPRDMALQGSLVKLTATVLQVAPSMANHDVMQVSMGSGATPVMFISVSKYSGVGCQRTTLGAAAVGSPVGDITGLLQYSFGQWIIQPRQASDLPGVTCTMDGGVPDAGATPDGGPG